MVDTDRLKNLLFEQRKTYKDAAEALDISVTTFNSKINQHVGFKHEETINLADYLGLSNEEYMCIFLRKNSTGSEENIEHNEEIKTCEEG